MSQNELQRVVAEIHAEYATGKPVKGQNLLDWARAIEAAQAVAPGGVPDGWMRDKDQVTKLAEHLESFGWRQNERGDVECHDQGAAMAAEVVRNVLLPMLAAAPASDAKGPNFLEEIGRNGEPTGYLLFGLVPRFRQAVRSLAGWKGEKPTVYAEDIETLVEVLRELKSKPAASSAAGEPEDRVDVALTAYNRAYYQWTQRDKDDRDEPRHRFAMRAAVAALEAK